jgi:hypothetical protein
VTFIETVKFSALDPGVREALVVGRPIAEA